jgi:hypothetical protein
VATSATARAISSTARPASSELWTISREDPDRLVACSRTSPTRARSFSDIVANDCPRRSWPLLGVTSTVRSPSAIWLAVAAKPWRSARMAL